MKIAYLVPSLINRGPVIVVRDLINVMTAYGHQCTIYYFDELEHTNINCPTERICMRNSINFNDFDVVHSHGIRSDFYVFYISLWLAEQFAYLLYIVLYLKI